MARWPTAAPRRRPGWQRWLPATLVVVAAGALGYWYQPQLLQSPSTEIAETQTTPLTPSLYGSPERELAIPGVGIGMLVESGGPSPLAVIVTEDADGVADHAGVQALLEREGVASLALPLPADSAGAAALTRWMAQAAAVRRLPVRLVVPGTLLDHWLALSPATSIPLLVLGPAPARRTLREVWFPLLRFASDTLDERLARWDDVAAVVATEDTLAARRLVRSAVLGRVVILAGETADPPSPHPDPPSWRETIAILRGYWEGMVEVEVGNDGLVNGER